MGSDSRNLLDFETNTIQKVTDKCEPQIPKLDIASKMQMWTTS